MPAARRRTTKAAAKPKAARVEEPEELEEDDDLETLDEDEVADEKPAGKSTASAVTFGVRDVCDLIKTETGEMVDARGLRTLIRKMARDKSGRVDRDIVPGNRTRYDWSGPNDPEVRAIVEAFKGGELEADKQAKLAELKERKAKQTAAKKAAEEAGEDEEETPKPRRRTKKATAAPVRKRRAKSAPVEEVEDDDELELDEDDE